ncbi:MAG TPA: alanine racemase [Stellaceae bacterium]|nr:alanine racemase [Stellaceae bacterium]
MASKRPITARNSKSKAAPRRSAVSAAEARAGAILEIDLGAIAGNWRLLQSKVGRNVRCAGVVKANAYGLGVVPVAKTLAAAGCKSFFVASLDEALALRDILKTPEIVVLNGVDPGNARDFLKARLTPVLNDLGQVETWRGLSLADPRARQPAILHLDTGMNRLGLSRPEIAVLTTEPDRLAGVTLRAIMTHLACAEEPEHEKNADQRRRFVAARRQLPSAPASIANSSGIFLGPDFHFDLVRPGAALYGLNPVPGTSNPMAQVVSLKGKILQVRDVDRGESVGYGARHRMNRGGRIATVAVGYADGWLRASSERGAGRIGGHEAPIVGRISMDLMTLDVTAIDPGLTQPGAMMDLIDSKNTVDRVAERASTIGYEILTALGRRYHRVYRGA